MPRTPSDLRDHNCLTVAGNVLSHYRAWHLTAANGTALNISPMGNLRSNSGAVLIVAAFAGHGLVYLPTYFVGEALQSGRLVTVLDDYTAPPLTLRALYPHNRHLSAKVRAFVDFLASRFGREPPWDSWCRAPGGQSALPAPHQREMIRSATKPRRSKLAQTLHDLALRMRRERARGRKTGPLGVISVPWSCRRPCEFPLGPWPDAVDADCSWASSTLLGLRAGNRPCRGHSRHRHAVYEADRRIQD
jgi:hypothetical protein